MVANIPARFHLQYKFLSQTRAAQFGSNNRLSTTPMILTFFMPISGNDDK